MCFGGEALGETVLEAGKQNVFQMGRTSPKGRKFQREGFWFSSVQQLFQIREMFKQKLVSTY